MAHLHDFRFEIFHSCVCTAVLGPTPEGEIPAQVEEKMRALGKWTHKYEEAIYRTEQGIAVEYYHGDSTLSEDGRTLYLFCNDKPNGLLLSVSRNMPFGNVAGMAFGYHEDRKEGACAGKANASVTSKSKRKNLSTIAQKETEYCCSLG